MTTIAATRKAMAADSMLSDESDFLHIRKLSRFSNGAIVGCAGSLVDIDKVMRWLIGGQKNPRPKITKDFEALVLTPKGLFYLGPSLLLREVTDGIAAIGTGTQAATAALRRGWSPRKAVEHACTADKSSRPPVHVMVLTK